MNDSVLQNTELLVEQSDVKNICFSISPLRPLKADEVVVRLDKFGFTSNNVTYAVLGKKYHYFDFFPATDDKYGKVNVWGYGTIVKSANSELQVGERIFGYFPLAKYVILNCPKDQMRAGSFHAVREKQLPGDWRVYNEYHHLDMDPHYSENHEDHILIFRPLWWTSYFLSDFLEEKKYFDSKTIIISSASSKTSFGLAYLLGKRRRNLIGLTSQRNKSFVEKLGLYHSVITYEDLPALKAKVSSVPASSASSPASSSSGHDEKCVYVDVAGDAKLLDGVYAQLGAQLSMVVQVGLSHWDQIGNNMNNKSFPFPCELFFCPSWIKKRSADLGPELADRMVAAWETLLDNFDKWTAISFARGEEAVDRIFKSVLDGSVNPEQGFVLSLWDDDVGLPPKPERKKLEQFVD